jgi:hypothetical protein
MMNQPVVIVGPGQIGSILAQGFLQISFPVYPVTRQMAIPAEAAEIPDPLFVLVAVKEEQLHPVLGEIPGPWRDRLALLQNELLPRDWQEHGLPHPTVLVAWFERRKTGAPDPYYPSPVYGPQAGPLFAALQALNLPAYLLDDPDELLIQLARKNLYILSKNIAGLVEQGTVGEVWAARQGLFREVAEEVFSIQEWLAGARLPHERLMKQLAADIETLPEKPIRGSTAPARLRRAIGYAKRAGLAVPRLHAIQASLEAGA